MDRCGGLRSRNHCQICVFFHPGKTKRLTAKNKKEKWGIVNELVEITARTEQLATPTHNWHRIWRGAAAWDECRHWRQSWIGGQRALRQTKIFYTCSKSVMYILCALNLRWPSSRGCPMSPFVKRPLSTWVGQNAPEDIPPLTGFRAWKNVKIRVAT